MTLVKEKQVAWLLLGLSLAVFLLALMGCNKTGGAQGGGSAALVAAGQSAVAANNCARCHSIGGQGGRMGPDLTHVGANPAHTPQWLAEHVKNPKSHNPSSRMPAFQGTINDQNLNAIGAYLASLK